ncbi:acyltransferase family protein [Thalassotalea aquiviva]|uniref:acyltransferase family protein n=1 Tax=Thalassotalea aquiviva TaxID=3242415 RepID=UPI003529EE7B
MLFQIKSLDGLRGIAALIVLLSHTSNVDFFLLPYFDFSGTGKSGVYLFFILSSFLLTYPMLKYHQDIFSHDAMVRYWRRRFFRICPLYFLYLLAGLSSSLVLNHFFGPKEWAIPFQLTISEFFQHILLLAGKGVTWSIAVEFKYYFFLPFVAWFSAKLLNKGVVAAIVVLFALILALLWSFPEVSFKNKPTDLAQYFPVFLFGTILACLQAFIDRCSNVKIIPKYLFSLLCYLSILAFILTIPSIYSILVEPVSPNYFSRERVLYCVIWSVLLISLINSKTLICRFLSHNYLRYLGKISFSVYLIHPVVIDLIRHFNIHTPVNAWVVLFLTLLISSLTFTFIEKPFIQFASKDKVLKPKQANSSFG